MKKVSMIVWNNLNTMICGICGGMALSEHNYYGMAGWLCAALAWQQSNWHRMWMDQWEHIAEKALDILHVLKGSMSVNK